MAKPKSKASSSVRSNRQAAVATDNWDNEVSEAWMFMRDAIREYPEGQWYFSGTDSTIKRSVEELETLLWW